MGPRSCVGRQKRPTGWNNASNLGPSNSRRHLSPHWIDSIILHRSNTHKRSQECQSSIQTITGGVKLKTKGTCITISITSKASSHLKQRILQRVICVQPGVVSLFSWKCRRDIAERCTSKQRVLLSQ